MLKRRKAVKVVGILLVGVFIVIAVNVWSTGVQEEMPGEKLMPLSVEIWERNKVPAELGTVEDNPWTRWIKEQVKVEGIDLSFIAVPRNQSQQMLNVMMASNTAPDIIFEEHYWIVATYAMQGGLHDLTEPLKTHGQQLVETLGPVVVAAGQLEGKQYAINALRSPPNQVHSTGYIRKDWLDKLGLDIPETTDELAIALKQFKQKDPGGVGVENVIPWGKLRKTVNLWYSHELSHDIMYAFMDHDIEKLWTTPVPLREGFEDWLRWLNDLYKSGCIDPEFATRPDNEAFQQMMNNQVGFYPCHTGRIYTPRRGLITNLRKIVPEARWYACFPYKGKDGIAWRENRHPYRYYNMVPKTCEYPEAAIKYMQWQVKPDIQMIQHYGFEGEHYEWSDDGIPTSKGIKDGKEFDYSDYVGKTFSYIKNDVKIMGDLWLGEDIYWKQIKAGYVNVYDEQTANDYIYAIKSALENSYNLPEFKIEIKSWTKYGAELRKSYDEYWVRCVMADDFDSVYADFQKELKARGIDEYAAERKAYYERYEKK